MERTIYIVTGEKGDYDYHSSWSEGAYVYRQDAEKRAEELNHQAKVNALIQSQYLEWHRKFNEICPMPVPREDVPPKPVYDKNRQKDKEYAKEWKRIKQAWQEESTAAQEKVRPIVTAWFARSAACNDILKQVLKEQITAQYPVGTTVPTLPSDRHSSDFATYDVEELTLHG